MPVTPGIAMRGSVRVIMIPSVSSTLDQTQGRVWLSATHSGMWLEISMVTVDTLPLHSNDVPQVMYSVVSFNAPLLGITRHELILL